MSGTKTVAGSGYGNALVDSLIWGGHAWDLTKGPVRVISAKQFRTGTMRTELLMTGCSPSAG